MGHDKNGENEKYFQILQNNQAQSYIVVTFYFPYMSNVHGELINYFLSQKYQAVK